MTIHETATGKIVAAVEGHYYGGDFAFHPRRPVLAIHRGDRVVLHDVPAGTETDLGPGRGPVCFDAAGDRLAVSGNRVTVYDLAGGPPRALAVGGEPLRFTPDGLLLRSNEGGKGRLHLWDVAADRAVASTPEGWRAASVDPAARWAVLYDAVWDCAAGKKLWPLPKLHTASYRDGVPFSPTEPLVAYEREGNTRTVELFDVTTGQVRNRLLIPGRGPQALLYGRFRPDGSILAVEDDDEGDVTLWEVGTGKLLTTLPEHNKAAWSPDGRYLVAFCSAGWAEVAPGSRTKGGTSHLRIYEVSHLPGRGRLDRAVNRLSFSADGTELAAADTVWRLESVGGRPRLRWAAQAPDKRTTFFDPGGRRWTFPLDEFLKLDAPFTLVRVGPEARTVTFPGRPHRGFPGNQNAGRLADVAVAPDGRRTVLVWDGYQESKPGDNSWTHRTQLECWDLDGPRLVGVWAEGNTVSDFQSVTFSPDGKRLAAVGNYGLQVWDAETGQRLTPKGADGRASSRRVAFAPDGRHVAVGYDGGWVALLTPDGTLVAEHQAHDGDVTAVAFSPDGRYLASAAEDRSVAVWDPGTMRRLAQWTAADAKVTAAAFAPDGRTLAVGDAKGVVQAWDVRAVLDELTGLGFKARE